VSAVTPLHKGFNQESFAIFVFYQGKISFAGVVANQVVLVPAEPTFAYSNHITVKSIYNFGAEFVFVSLKIIVSH